MNEGEAFFKIPILDEIVKAVKAAGYSTHRSVKLEFSHILKQKENVAGQLKIELAIIRLVKHIVRAVNSYHIVAAARKLKGHTARAARKIENKLGAFLQKFIKALFKKVRPGRVINV